MLPLAARRALLAEPLYIEPMSSKQSQFGSLSDRLGDKAAGSKPSGVQHAWLDGDVPVLLVRWRQTEARVWEGLIIGVTEHGPAMCWVRAARLRAADTQPPAASRGGLDK